MTQRSRADDLAAKLDGMVSAKVLSGLLPETVSAAAEMLRQQESELASLRAALSAKEHTVSVTVSETQPYSKDVRAEFVIADPQRYFGEMRVDDRWTLGDVDPDWEMHVARTLTRVATSDWLRDLEQRAYVGVRKAIAASPPASASSLPL